jgi:hypothetical protein
MTAAPLIRLLWLAPDNMTAAQLRAIVVKHMQKVSIGLQN